MANNKLQRDKKYIIKGYDKNINKDYRQHLLVMGLIPGATFLVKRFAPFSRTVQIDLEQFSLKIHTKKIKLKTPIPR